MNCGPSQRRSGFPGDTRKRGRSLMRWTIWLVATALEHLNACQPYYAQCGGQAWTGGTTCCESACRSDSPYYAQCPGPESQQQQPPPQSQQQQPRRPAFVDAFADQLPSLPSSTSELQERWSRAAEEDPRLVSLLHFLGAVGIFLAFALLTFCRMRLQACISSSNAVRARDLEALSTVELEPMDEATTPGGRRHASGEQRKKRLGTPRFSAPRREGRTRTP